MNGQPNINPRDVHNGRVRCDALGCIETHPVEHEFEGQPGFTRGRWAGWVYLDINDPHLSMRPLRFCSYWCLRYWLEDIEHAQRQRARYKNADPPSLDDDVVRPDEVRRHRERGRTRPHLLNGVRPVQPPVRRERDEARGALRKQGDGK